MKKNILICVGGTGGHVFPAQALAEQLVREKDRFNILFAGGGLQENPYFQQSSFPFREVNCGTFKRDKMLASLWEGRKIISGVVQAMKVIKDFQPDLIVGFGSYYTFPLLVAARFLSIPIVLHEGNAVPGMVNKLFSKKASITGVLFPETQRFLKGKTIEVGMPLRAGYTKNFGSVLKAKEYFGLDPDKATFLVFGGSQGALVLNTHFCGSLIDLSERTKNFQIIHLTGDPIVSKEVMKVYKSLGINHYVKEFEKQMDQAYLASDLVISRAGASTIAELIEYELPSILIPYPYATDDHQMKNATILEQKIKGSITIPQDKLTAEGLSKAIFSLFNHDRSKLKQLHENIREYKGKSIEKDLKSIVCDLVGANQR
jgi:UDP-N-acetylglucosamine--N-acetylmuramyl-(pentapeptide) pyrophosphoryl-undecaprenol N-acetylglucosamine transferase